MRELVDLIEARYPLVAQRCDEAAATWLSGEVARLEEGQSLRRSKDDIVPGLAQAVRGSGVELAEIARECGIDSTELRKKLALSRAGELMKPGEVWDLSEEELGSKLQQAAREYSLGIEDLLDGASRPSTETPINDSALPLKPKTLSAFWLLRCLICRSLRRQSYRIDFTAYVCSGFHLFREPVYACSHCLRMHLVNRQVLEVTRLSISDIPKSPAVAAWSTPFVAVVILVLFVVYMRQTGQVRGATRISVPSVFANQEHLGTEAAPFPDEAERVLGEASQLDLSATPPLLTQVPVPKFIVPSLTADASQVTDNRKRDKVAALSAQTTRETNYIRERHRSQGYQSGQQSSERPTAVNNCRQILRNERPLARYSINNAEQDGDKEAVSAAEACKRTVANLARSGNECAGLFNWFMEFQTSLTSHVNRVCHEAVRQSAVP
jgi:hypothetical protein